MKPPRPTAENEQPEGIQGVLRALHLDDDWLEVTTLASGSGNAKHLRTFREEYGRRCRPGLVLHTGDATGVARPAHPRGAMVEAAVRKASR